MVAFLGLTFTIHDIIPYILKNSEKNKILEWKKDMKKMDKYRIDNYLPYFKFIENLKVQNQDMFLENVLGIQTKVMSSKDEIYTRMEIRYRNKKIKIMFGKYDDFYKPQVDNTVIYEEEPGLLSQVVCQVKLYT